MRYSYNARWTFGFMKTDSARRAVLANSGFPGTKHACQSHCRCQKQNLKISSSVTDDWATARPISSCRMAWRVPSHALRRIIMTTPASVIFSVPFSSTQSMQSWIKPKSLSHALIQGGMSCRRTGKRNYAKPWYDQFPCTKWMHTLYTIPLHLCVCLLFVCYFLFVHAIHSNGPHQQIVNLLAYPPSKKLHSQLVKYPQEVVPAMDQTVNKRDLNPTDTDKLVAIKGLVIRATPVIPDMKVAFFRCLSYSHIVQVEIDRSKIEEPARYPHDICGSVGTMSQTPHTISLSIYNELVDVLKHGDCLVVTGIFRSIPLNVNPHQ
ncbi:uncharacterized protein LACBIDRAFT_317158 [Laccaria bicolor S238N-H82]|uniref:Predicted protein n=1 Tax=Laccaria bicolor (strain S238N-H82 / ATCC MYA-4686) TaxID=486041 RepID=B0D4I7_LACBS|nr:uncharacterized protein LACBIDRAFT_317158 [Laccaria bicolor S238N-H82]EDR10569.1 predicted protein [Laccaria bicolor S238N-H82]|eukprot:XP_001879019.1 predicted protein [Laccaria bicolor S238N-H82]